MVSVEYRPGRVQECPHVLFKVTLRSSVFRAVLKILIVAVALILFGSVF